MLRLILNLTTLIHQSKDRYQYVAFFNFFLISITQEKMLQDYKLDLKMNIWI